MLRILFGILWMGVLYLNAQSISQVVVSCDTEPNNTEVYYITQGPYDYGWEVEGGIILTGEYTNEIKVDWYGVDTGLYIIYASITNKFGCADTSEIYIKVTDCPFDGLYIPNAFTPNNDYLNDVFSPKGHFDQIMEYKMTIWNRWGQKIFESHDYSDGWDGTTNGNICQIDAYVYLIEFRVNDTNQFRVGQVMLAR